MDKAKQAGKPFFVWHNTTRMSVGFLRVLPVKETDPSRISR